MMLTGQPSDNSVYWKLYLSTRLKGLVTVVCMQWFDEPDYDSDMFVKNKDGEPYYFTDENEAIEKLNVWYKKKDIDPEYHRPMKKTDLIR